MAINKTFIGEFTHELDNTRKLISSIPDSILDYKPHEKSMSVKQLAAHIVDMYSWFDICINYAELDFSKGDYKAKEVTTIANLVALLDEYGTKALAILQNTTDETFLENWTMRNGEQIFFTMTKVAVTRSFCMNHVYHHRGQLEVYLRLNNVALPNLYGPTADNPMM